jgi:phage-related protein
MANVLPFRLPVPTVSLRLREVVKDGSREMSKWFAANTGARARFRIRVEHLQKIDRNDWAWAQFHKLEDGLAEIKWKSGKKQFRAIGFDHNGWFVMVLGCTHKMSVYDPPGYLTTAKRIMREVENEQWNTVEFTP